MATSSRNGPDEAPAKRAAPTGKPTMGDRPVTRSGHVLDVPGKTTPKTGPRNANGGNGANSGARRDVDRSGGASRVAATQGRAGRAGNGGGNWWDQLGHQDRDHERMRIAADVHRFADQIWSPQVDDTRATSRVQDPRLYEQAPRQSSSGTTRQANGRSGANGANGTTRNGNGTTSRAQPPVKTAKTPVKPQSRARGSK
jgi:hypothetical protein